jgi:hypothetical protein
MTVGVDKLRRGTNALTPPKSCNGKSRSAPRPVPSPPAERRRQSARHDRLRHRDPDGAGGTLAAGRFSANPRGPCWKAVPERRDEIWRLAGKVLKPEQQAELRRRLRRGTGRIRCRRACWRRARWVSPRKWRRPARPTRPNPAACSTCSWLIRSPAWTRPCARLPRRGCLPNALSIVTQKMPMLLRWQTELLSVNAVEMPAVQQLVTNSTQIAASVERFARRGRAVAGQVSTEREEILKALQSQEKDVNEVAQTSGTQMSTSLNTTLTTFDALMKRFGVGETNSAGPPKTNAEPFRIQDYAQTAAQLEGDGAAVDRVARHARSNARLDEPPATFGASRPGGSAGANRRQGDRGLRFLERHPAGGHRAGGRLDLPLSQRTPDFCETGSKSKTHSL